MTNLVHVQLFLLVSPCTVTFAITAIYSYVWILPALLWAWLWWRGVKGKTSTLLALICVYGYSLAIFVPSSVSWLMYIYHIMCQRGVSIMLYTVVIVHSVQLAFQEMSILHCVWLLCCCLCRVCCLCFNVQSTMC